MPRKPCIRLPQLAPGQLTLSRDQSHYLSRVLRLADGAEVDVIDAKGRHATGVLQSSGTLLDIPGPIHSYEQPFTLTVAMATPKGDRADWAVEKLTEVGATSIQWVTFERSVVTPKAGSNKLARWQRLAESAARQSERPLVPEVVPPIPLDEFLKRTFDWHLVAHPDAPAGYPSATQEVDSAALVIGPEGGITRHELETLVETGYHLLTLGSGILRVETAAVVGAAQLAAVLEETKGGGSVG